MICYFQEGLKLFIKIEMVQQDWKFMDFENMVQKTVNVEAKAGLRSSTIVRESDIRCFQGYYSFYNTFSKVQTNGTTARKSHTKESRPKEAKLTDGKAPVPPRSNEPAKPNRKKKKRKWLKKKNSIPATGDIAIKGKKKQTSNNTSQVTCYNCQKKGHFANKYLKPPKNQR